MPYKHDVGVDVHGSQCAYQLKLFFFLLSTQSFHCLFFRFDDIVGKLKQFLKQAGFRDSEVSYVPVSGLLGENLTERSKEPFLCQWYKGPSLLEVNE